MGLFFLSLRLNLDDAFENASLSAVWLEHFLQKADTPTAINVPSVCPNCGLDLEHPYVRERA